jgi:hypothetical protein
MSAATHILLGGPNQSPLELRTSVLASARLRLALAAAAAQQMGQDVTIGENCPEKADNLVVGKIGANNLEARQGLWLFEIKQLKLQGARIVLDYTDHHLGNNSVMTPFYRAAIELADVVCVPTNTLRATLVKQYSPRGKIEVIPDLLEYDLVKPKEAPVGKRPVAMWFGHPSNAEFLAKFIESHHDVLAGHQLNIVSTPHTVAALKQYPFSKPPAVSLAFYQWSIDAVAKVAEVSDYCIIPSDTDSSKRYASNNRLITALALGLPTLATPLPSYIEFSDYFVPIKSGEDKHWLATSSEARKRIKSFQELHTASFSSPELVRQWSLLMA